MEGSDCGLQLSHNDYQCIICIKEVLSLINLPLWASLLLPQTSSFIDNAWYLETWIWICCRNFCLYFITRFSIPFTDAVSGSSLDNGSASPEEGFTLNHLGSQGMVLLCYYKICPCLFDVYLCLVFSDFDSNDLFYYLLFI